MKAKLLLIFTFLYLGSVQLFSQGHEANLEKYWSYRDRLTTDFMVIGDGQGMSMPAQQLDTTSQFLKWADNTIWLGWYIGTLVLEYKMLSNPHLYPGYDMDGDRSVEQTLDELYYALRGLQRLDANAESVFPSPCDTLTNEENGFFIRDDVPTGFDSNFTGISQIISDYNSPNVYDKEMSQDQAYHVLMGLALVKKFIPTDLEVNGMLLRDEAVKRAKLIVEWMSQAEWIIKSPVCMDNGDLKNVMRGENASLLSPGLNEMIKYITDGNVNYDSELDPFSIAVWSTLVLPDNPGYDNSDNLHMAMVIASVGKGWGDSTLQVLMNLAELNQWTAYPMLFTILHQAASTPGFTDFKATMNLWAEQMLDEAPVTGPYNSYPDTSTHGYAVNHRFIRPRRLHYTGNHFTAGSLFHGLDYMFLHNLYYVVSPSKWPVTLIKEFNRSFFMKLYPNPADSKLYLDLTSNSKKQFQLSIYNVLGQEMLNLNFVNKERLEIDIENFRKGIYYIRLLGNPGAKFASGSFIKED